MQAELKRHEPLYLKHRPQSLGQLVGQEAVKTTLTNAINHDRISHAYLFTGPRGTGKTSSARILAKSLNCKQSDKATVEPCQQCASCEEIKSGVSPAVLEIDAASNNSVDDARVLIERAPLVAPGARYKVYIIDECHMLTKEAFNALLKTIEDPPANVIFVLATTEEHKVLPTIVSRCQRLMFRLVKQGDLTAHLRKVATDESIEIEDDALAFIARRSGGGLRDALGLLDQASLLSSPGNPVKVTDLLKLLGALQEDVLLDISRQIQQKQGQEVLSSVSKLLEEGREPAVIVQELARHFLALMKASYLADAGDEAMASVIIASPGYIAGLREQAPTFDRSELSQMVEALDRLEQTCRRTSQPGMHLEVGLLGLCHRQDVNLLRDLAERVARLEAGAPIAAAPAPRPMAPQARPQPAAVVATASVQPPSTTISTEQSTPAAAGVAESAAVEEAPVEMPKAPVAQSAPVQSGWQPQPEETTPDRAQAAPAASSASAPAAPAATAPAASSNSAPPAETEETGESTGEDLDYIWSSMLDELQRRNIPAFSIASMHAFPLSVTTNEFVLGTKEMMQKNLESRAEHIKAALQVVTGRQMFVKVKAIAGQMPAPAPARSAPPRTTSPAPAMSAASSGSGNGSLPIDYDDEGEEADLSRYSGSASATAVQERPLPINSVGGAPGPDDYPETDAAQAHQTNQSQTAAQPRPRPPLQDGVDSTMVKEAYKLFEGPGSRRISPNTD